MTTSPRWKRRPEGSTWGDFGPDDQLGRLNLLTPEKVKQGVAEVREGLSFCLSLPLDDGNVERFCNLLDEMIRLTDTRFVIITHNPITMARMNRLFGVTMAQR